MTVISSGREILNVIYIINISGMDKKGCYFEDVDENGCDFV